MYTFLVFSRKSKVTIKKLQVQHLQSGISTFAAKISIFAANTFDCRMYMDYYYSFLVHGYLTCHQHATTAYDNCIIRSVRETIQKWTNPHYDTVLSKEFFEHVWLVPALFCVMHPINYEHYLPFNESFEANSMQHLQKTTCNILKRFL